MWTNTVVQQKNLFNVQPRRGSCWLPNHFVSLVDVPIRDVTPYQPDDNKQPSHHFMDSSSMEMSSSFHSSNKFNVLIENEECPDNVTAKPNTKVTETQGETTCGKR